jgi:hypothetical protein
MEELKPRESEALDIIESLLDVADMKNTGPMYADNPPRSGMCRIPEDDAAKLRQYIAARRTAPENKALTLFDKITESPEKLAKFLGAIDIGKIELDKCFCKCDCGDDSGCPHELQCIINWLDKPEGSKKS